MLWPCFAICLLVSAVGAVPLELLGLAEEETVLPVDAGEPDPPGINESAEASGEAAGGVSSEMASILTESVTDLGRMSFGTPSHERGKRESSWSSERRSNPEEEGKYVEGDIIRPFTRSAIVAKRAHWPYAVVHYMISPHFSYEAMANIKRALRAFHKLTCVRFRPYTGRETDFINITRSKDDCSSWVGRKGGAQTLNLEDPRCTRTVGTPAHELMHALGFVHEHNRYDRDKYVTIKWQNIIPGKERNFEKPKKEKTSTYGLEYDYNSVMHYSAYASSKNRQTTIVPNDRMVRLDQLGQRKGLSKRDILKINRMYEEECQKRKYYYG